MFKKFLIVLIPILILVVFIFVMPFVLKNPLFVLFPVTKSEDVSDDFNLSGIEYSEVESERDGFGYNKKKLNQERVGAKDEVFVDRGVKGKVEFCGQYYKILIKSHYPIRYLKKLMSKDAVINKNIAVFYLETDRYDSCSNKLYTIYIPNDFNVEPDKMEISFSDISVWDKYDIHLDTDLGTNRGHGFGKPIIYLYGYNGDVSVKLNISKGTKIGSSYPKYNNGWNFKALPDGTLIKDGREFNYLYYEGTRNHSDDITEGFCIKGEDTIAFLEEYLPKLGLTDKEQDDFISYWLPQMENNPYNLISFTQDQFDKDVGLDINPAPDKIIRVFMTFKSCDEFINIPKQNIKDVSHEIRNGKTVVEWGGEKSC